MKKIFVGFILMGVIIITSCSFEEPTNEEIFYELQKTINDMESYSCKANITITGNKSPSRYIANHLYKKPYSYKVNYFNKKQSISYDGNRIYLSYPKVDTSIIIRDSKKLEEDKNLFIGYFIKLITTNEDIMLEKDIIDNNEYLVISLELPGNNIYRAKEKLWIDKKTFKPYKLRVLDIDGKEQVNVLYKDFKYNIELQDSTFKLDI